MPNSPHPRADRLAIPRENYLDSFSCWPRSLNNRFQLRLRLGNTFKKRFKFRLRRTNWLAVPCPGDPVPVPRQGDPVAVSCQGDPVTLLDWLGRLLGSR